MTPHDVISHYGTQAAAADALDLSQPSISDWVRAGSVPWLRQLDIERMTNGALRANPEDREREIALRKRGKPAPTEATA